MRSRYWRTNAFQPGSVLASASLFGPNLSATAIGLGVVEARSGVDGEPGTCVCGGQGVPGDGLRTSCRGRSELHLARGNHSHLPLFLRRLFEFEPVRVAADERAGLAAQ